MRWPWRSPSPQGTKAATSSAVLAFGKTPIVEVKPAETMKGITLLSSIEYGVLPGFVGDDLVIAPAQYPSDSTLYAPCENLFLGLLKGESSVLVMTWPKGKQQMRLGLSKPGQEGACSSSRSTSTMTGRASTWPCWTRRASGTASRWACPTWRRT